MKRSHTLLAAGGFLASILTAQTQPAITNQPHTTASAIGTTAIFSVAARGAGAISYQWQRDLSDLPGCTNAVLSLSHVQPSDQAEYRVVVTDASGSVTSAVARLHVMSFATMTARAVLDTFDDNQLTGWINYGAGLLIESNQQFTVRGWWPGQRTTAFYDTYCVAAAGAARTLGAGQTLEWRVELVHLDDPTNNAVKFVIGTTTGVYGFFKWHDSIAMTKYDMRTVSLFAFDRVSIPNANVVLAFALTRLDPNVIRTCRVLSKDHPDRVLYERSIVDTPNSDPTLTAAQVRALSGMDLLFGPEAEGAPYINANAAIGLFQYTDGRSPAATVTFDNLELWTYRVSTRRMGGAD